jgi:hypothetical protein
MIEDERQSMHALAVSEMKLSDPLEDPMRRVDLNVPCLETVVQAIAVTARDSKLRTIFPLMERWRTCRGEDLRPSCDFVVIVGAKTLLMSPPPRSAAVVARIRPTVRH